MHIRYKYFVSFFLLSHYHPLLLFIVLSRLKKVIATFPSAVIFLTYNLLLKFLTDLNPVFCFSSLLYSSLLKNCNCAASVIVCFVYKHLGLMDAIKMHCFLGLTLLWHSSPLLCELTKAFYFHLPSIFNLLCSLPLHGF